METLIPLMVIAVGALAVGLVVRSRRAHQQRTAELAALADRLGWGFREELPVTATPEMKQFELFRLGSNRRMRNFLTSPAGELRAVVFDYSYSISSGKSQQTYRQTIFYATSDAFNLPSFSLRPEHFFHRIGTLFGHQDIDFDHRPEFSRLFLLRGDDEAAVRQAIRDSVIDFFERRPRICSSGSGHELLLWRPGRLADREQIEQLIRDGMDLAARFLPAQKPA